jgi:hypothetical protein
MPDDKRESGIFAYQGNQSPPEDLPEDMPEEMPEDEPAEEVVLAPEPEKKGKGKRKVARGKKVTDLMEDDGRFNYEAVMDDMDTLDQHFADLNNFFKNLQASEMMDNCRIQLFRMLPEVIDEVPSKGFLEKIPWPITAPELYEMVSKKHGGGTYRCVFWDEKGNSRGQLVMTLPGIPIRFIERKPELPDLASMTPRERELEAILSERSKKEAIDSVRMEYEAKTAKEKSTASNELLNLVKAILTQRTGVNVGEVPNEIKEHMRRQEDMIQDLREELKKKDDKNVTVEMIKAMAEMNKPKESGNTLEWVKILLPVVIDKLKPKDGMENPMFQMLLGKILDQKTVPTEEALKKVMDMNLDFTKKVAEMQIEKIMDGEGEGDDGTITPKDILTTVSGAFETMMKRFGGVGRAPQIGQPQYPQQQIQGTTSPPVIEGEAEEEEEEEESQENVPVQNQEKQPVIKLNDEVKEQLKGSIKAGNPGANFGKILLRDLPLSNFKEVIKSTDIPGLVKIIEPFLKEAVGDEIRGLLIKTENGKKYMTEAIEYVKAHV